MLEHAGETTILERLEAHAAKAPLRPFACLYAGEAFTVLTYGDLLARADAWGARLAGFGRGRVVLIALGHGADLYAAFLGAMRAGLTPSFLPPPSPRQDPALYAKAQAMVITRLDPAAIVADAPSRAALQPVAGAGRPFLAPRGEAPTVFTPVRRRPDETALLQHSSGTTGMKKAVSLTFAQVDAHAGMLAQALSMGRGDIVASWLPLYHDMGLFAAFLVPLTLGASLVALDAHAWVADPMSWLRAIDRHRATLTWAPNFAFAHLVRTRGEHPAVDLSPLRALIDCSEPCRPETLAGFATAFADCGFAPGQLAACYGMAEVAFAATQTRPGRPPRTLALDAQALEAGRIAPARVGERTRRLASCGLPLPGVELRIDAAYGRTGEILVKSATRIDGYVAGPDPGRLQDGWRRSGDIGLIDGGELFVCGRIKEMLIVAGRNLYAGDVEAVVSAIPGVKPGRAVALVVEGAATEALAILLEAEPTIPVEDAELHRRVRAAVSGAFDVSPQVVAVAPAGTLVKSTAGKMSRAENLARLRALIPYPSGPLPSPSMGEGPGLGVWTQASSVNPGGSVTDSVLEADTVCHHPHPQTSPHRGGKESLSAREQIVAQALADCFGVSPAAITADTTPDDIPGWDSLGHTTLILRLEALAGVRLTEAAAEARTVGDLARALDLAAARAA